jgi:hypothetical protein
VIYLTNYGQPETSPSWTERWGRFHRDIDNLPVCNLAFAGLWGIRGDATRPESTPGLAQGLGYGPLKHGLLGGEARPRLEDLHRQH